ncbi:MAG TPA: GAF domain-containing sensor histidine kinase [Thermoanaerobaculia bacterium]|jgi:signal transduction histidine kinase|nr:GAF domain-containing sensor histidine kinase [Thermoanaerobaculia bacterium]
MASQATFDAPNVRRLRYVAVGGPLLLLVVVELAQWLLAPQLSPWVARLIVFSMALLLLVVFYDQVFRRLEKIERRLQRQNQELLELHSAALVISADLSLETVLQTIVDRACTLLGTRYGAISVVDQAGGITSFVTAGIDEELRLRIGDPPHGRGVLGVPLHEGQRLRLDDISKDPRSVGFPPGHPPMHSLLAVPVICRVPHHGNLYLSEKEDGGGFTADDEAVLVRFADQAAIAIDNAYLYNQVRELGAARERLRIAHEMHDGLAQVLAYVNTKAQVVREYLRQGRTEEAQKHLDEFAEAARGLYGDVRQQILELRTTRPEESGLLAAIADYAKGWGQQNGVEVELSLPPAVELVADAQRQVLRIVQEALANVRKHARATRVRIHVESTAEDLLRLRVSDDGHGFDAASPPPSAGGRFGLKTMAERAASIGATVAVSSQPGGGTTVEVTLPRAASTRRETAHATTAG